MLAHGEVTGKTARAAREAICRRKLALDACRSHLVETTLAGTGILRHMEAAGRIGYRILLHYVSLSTPDHALDRIRNRIALGGHDVPEADVRRRFIRSRFNLSPAVDLADEVLIYDNSSPDHPHREVAVFREGTWWVADSMPDWA